MNLLELYFHPHSLYYLSKYRHYITPDGVFHSCTCHVKPSDIDYDSVDQYKVFILSMGETRPMFLVVRCGKCILCRQRKLSQWCFRCLREANQIRKMLSFFLTLTYNCYNICLLLDFIKRYSVIFKKTS